MNMYSYWQVAHLIFEAPSYGNAFVIMLLFYIIFFTFFVQRMIRNWQSKHGGRILAEQEPALLAELLPVRKANQ